MKSPFIALILALALPFVAQSAENKNMLTANEPAVFAYNTCKDANGDFNIAKEILLSSGWTKSNEVIEIIKFNTHIYYVNTRAALSRKSEPHDWTDDTIKNSFPSTMFSDFDGLKKHIEKNNKSYLSYFQSFKSKNDWGQKNGFYRSPDDQSYLLIAHFSCTYLGNKTDNPILVDAFQTKYNWTATKSARGIMWYLQDRQKISITALTDIATTADPRLPTQYDLIINASFLQQKDKP